MIRFETATGSTYEIVEHPSGRVIRRVNSEAGKRADGEWIRLVNDPLLAVGESAYLAMESLSNYGSDDYGTHKEDASPYTFRTTSTVTKVERS